MIARLVGIRIKQLRAQQGLSQVEFSDKIDMSRTYFAEVETGKRNISLRNLFKIVDGFGLTLEEFFASELFDTVYSTPAGQTNPRRVLYSATRVPAKGETGKGKTKGTRP